MGYRDSFSPVRGKGGRGAKKAERIAVSETLHRKKFIFIEILFSSSTNGN